MKNETINIPKSNFESRHPVIHALCEAVGAVFMFFLIFAFCWICCAASGYHWE